MADRIKAAVDGRSDDSFVIMARTDAHAVEGQAAAIERAQLRTSRRRHDLQLKATLGRVPSVHVAVKVPVLANIASSARRRCSLLPSWRRSASVRALPCRHSAR
jgi:methylisocitrate lyase